MSRSGYTDGYEHLALYQRFLSARHAATTVATSPTRAVRTYSRWVWARSTYSLIVSIRHSEI